MDEEHTYRLEVSNDVDANGYHSVWIFKDDRRQIAIVHEDRDAAIAEAKVWVEWYKNHDESRETILL